MTDAPDPLLPQEHGAPAPRPGSLEHLADGTPHAPALIDAATAQTLTRAQHDALADALAAGLHAEHGVGPGTRVALSLAPAPDLLTLLFALAKLGAAPVLLPADLPARDAYAVASVAGCHLLVVTGLPRQAPAATPALLPVTALTPLAERHAGGPRRLSGARPPADSVQAATDVPGRPRLVVRERGLERIALLAPTVGDLLRRVGLPRGVHLLAPGGHAPEPQFWAGVALVTGSSVVTLAGDAHGDTAAGALLQALQTHAVTSTVLDATQLRGLLALPGSVTDAADLTALGRVVVVGPLDRPLVTAAADLLGEDVLHAVYATTQTGPVAHADTVALHDDPTGAGAPLDGVTVTVDADGALLVRSPLAADGALGDGVTRGPWPAPPAWRDAPVPTGHRGMLTGDGRVRVTGTVHPGDARD